MSTSICLRKQTNQSFSLEIRKLEVVIALVFILFLTRLHRSGFLAGNFLIYLKFGVP